MLFFDKNDFSAQVLKITFFSLKLLFLTKNVIFSRNFLKVTFSGKIQNSKMLFSDKNDFSAQVLKKFLKLLFLIKNVIFFAKISSKSLFLETLFFSEKVTFEEIFEKKDFFSSLHMILNLNLNNLHLVLELVYLISALIVEDE